MVKELTLKEVTDKVRKLEREILLLINVFENNTTCNVQILNIEHYTDTGNCSDINVEIKV